jgi:penicillin-binding protein 1C
MSRAWLSAPWLLRVAVRVFAALCAGLVALALGVVSRDDPRAKLERSRAYSVRVEDRAGRRLAELAATGGGFRRPVALSEISPHLVVATLSGEDAHFYHHPGIDPIGVARALWLDLRGGRLAYGGSTITQQVAKLIDPEPRTLVGKAREALDALRIEWALDKDEILTEYLNRASTR